MAFARLCFLCLWLLMPITTGFAAACTFVPREKIDRSKQLIVVAEGDSITSGIGSSTEDRSYAVIAIPLILQPMQLTIKAVSRSVLGWDGENAPSNSLYARLPDDARLVPVEKQGRVYVITVLIGRNDLVGYYGGLEQYSRLLTSYVTRLRESGWDRVVLGTLLPSDWASFEPVRRAFNDLVRSPCWASDHGIDGIADFAAIPELGSEAAAKQHAYFADGIHPNDAGYALMAPVYAAAINALRQ